jgi:hypothetical protein
MPDEVNRALERFNKSVPAKFGVPALAGPSNHPHRSPDRLKPGLQAGMFVERDGVRGSTGGFSIYESALARASCFANRIASIMLDGLAFPCPARS